MYQIKIISIVFCYYDLYFYSFDMVFHLLSENLFLLMRSIIHQMFYPINLLSRRQRGKFAASWLASTNSEASFKKLYTSGVIKKMNVEQTWLLYVISLCYFIYGQYYSTLNIYNECNFISDILFTFYIVSSAMIFWKQYSLPVANQMKNSVCICRHN